MTLMEVLVAAISLIVGSLVTWWFSRQASKELKARNDELRNDNATLRQVVEKLPAELHTVIANDPRTTLTIEQVAQLAASVGQLQQYASPRRLTADQRELLTAALRKLEPKPIRVVSAGNDDEAAHFCNQLITVFKEAGWPAGGGTAMAAMDVNGLSLDYFAGDTGTIPASAPPAADTIGLRAVLEGAGLSVRTRPLNEDEHHLHWLLSVGPKPRMS